MNMSLYIPLFLQGLVGTVLSWFFATLMSFLIGSCVGFLTSNFFPKMLFKRFLTGYIFIARGIPVYLQILIFYYVIPSFFAIQIGPFYAATAALAFCSSGYVAEIIRGGFNAVDSGQWQAAFVLGYPTSQALVRIIIPQVLYIVSPALFGEIEQLLKSTSMISTIGVVEITRVGLNIISRELNPIPVYCSIACIYLFLSFLLQRINVFFESRVHRVNR